MRINDILVEFAAGGSGDSGNYFQALASAWYNGTFDSGSLQKGIKSQQDVERLLNRGIVCPDGVTRKLHIDYNADCDGVEIYSDDYYEYGDYDDTIDSRTGQKWGPYDFMAFSDDQLDEATGDQKFDTMMGQIQREPKYPDSQMPPTDVKDLYQWAVKNNKPYHKIFANWANREGYKSVAPALQRAGNLDTEALDYWTPDVWKIYWGELNGIDSDMPPEWAKKRVPDELRDYLDTVFDAYDRIVFDWPTEYRQIGGQGNYAEGLNEFAADDGDSGGEDDALHKYAKMWWAGDEATQMQIEKVLARMGWEIGEDEGGYDNGGVFVVRAGDANGDSYTSWAAEDLTEADEWEEDTEKRERFLQYAKQKLMASNGNIEMAMALSKQDNKFFGSPFLNDPAAQQAPAGAVSIIDNRPYTRAIAQIMAYIESKQGQAEISATQAALWLTPQGKKFLERVSTDLYGIDDNAARKKHAIALSGYQVQHLGGKITGSYYGPDDFHSAEQNMTKEVAAIYDLVTLELEREAGIEGDARERQKDMAFWNAIPYPLKVVMCASLGKTPGQMESILFGTEADMLASHFGNKKPKPNADPTPAEPKKLGETGIGRAVNDKGLTQQRWLQLVQTKFPDAKIVQAKMIDGPSRATLPDGRTLSWTKVEQGVAEGVQTESAELAKQYGWAYNQGEYGVSMTHPKHGRISLSSPVTSRSGDTAVEREWTHNNASGIGDRSLAQHLQSLKEQGMAEGAPISGDGGAVDNFRQQMANNTELAYQKDMAEGNRKSEPPEADYGDDYQDMVKRVKKLAGLGPSKTQYDPAKRVYRNMPTAVQPKK